MEKKFNFDDDSYESKRIRNTMGLWVMRDQLQGKSDTPTLFTSDVNLKTRILPRFDLSDSESDQEPEASDANLPKIIVVDESAQPVADGDKAEPKKSPQKEVQNDVCFHEFSFARSNPNNSRHLSNFL